MHDEGDDDLSCLSFTINMLPHYEADLLVKENGFTKEVAILPRKKSFPQDPLTIVKINFMQPVSDKNLNN